MRPHGRVVGVDWRSVRSRAPELLRQGQLLAGAASQLVTIGQGWYHLPMRNQ
jgi:hypothetical protein